MLMAGDVGGTKTKLGLFEHNAGSLKLITSARYPSAESPSLEAIAHRFLDENKQHVTEPIEAACFGIPGPVVNGRVKVTNLPWEVVATEVSKNLKIPHVKLVNDLVSTAAALPILPPSGTSLVYSGEGTVDQSGLVAVVAPGTGLGHAFVHRETGRPVFLASEGGHANFAPTNEKEWRLLFYLQKKLKHVSVESVICGPGLANIYSFLRDSENFAESAALKEELSIADKASVITKHALDHSSDICVEALNMFCAILGAHCSNVVLSVLAVGGVYLGGGIPPKIAPALVEGTFIGGYLNKGKCIERVRSTPVHIIKDDSASLIGAGQLAFSLLDK